jgi:hypothetical protein
MQNRVSLSAESLAKAIQQMDIEYEEDYPLIGKVRVSLKEVRIGNNQMIIPVHTQVPLVGTFDVSMTDIRSEGTKATLRLDQVGAIPPPLISVVGCVVESLFGKVLKKATISIAGDRVTVDYAANLPILLKDIHVTSLVIRDGIEIMFDY